jgi:hypothetical protein
MPAAPRLKGKPAKIAFSILGVPANLKAKKSAAQRALDLQLLAQETQRVR